MPNNVSDADLSQSPHLTQFGDKDVWEVAVILFYDDQMFRRLQILLVVQLPFSVTFEPAGCTCGTGNDC